MKKLLRIVRNVVLVSGIVFGVVVVIAIIDLSNDPDQIEAASEEAIADGAELDTQEELDEPELSPDEQRRELVEEQFSAWDGSHLELVRFVKDSMNDPKSFEHIETKYRDDDETILIQMRFRGANAFGGLVVNTVVATADPTTGAILSAETVD